MRILFLTKIFPYPPDSGVKIKTDKILRILCRMHQVDLISISDDPKIIDKCKKAKLFCNSIKIFYKPIVTKLTPYFILIYLNSFLLRKPFIINKFYDNKIAKFICKYLAETNTDLIYIDNIHMAQYIPRDYKGRIICDSHEILFLTYSSFLNNEKNIIKKAIFTLEVNKLKKYESHFYPLFDHIFTISAQDKKNIVKVGVQPNRVTFMPVPYKIYPAFEYRKDLSNITFISSLSWFPNKEGIEWFIKKVFPLVLKEIPKVKLLIVGKGALDLKRKYTKFSSIKFMDYQKKLIPIYKKTSVFIVPILSGGGVRMKILEAMSHGIPVVSTRKGIEGINVINNKHVLIEYNPRSFARGVIRIINNRQLAKNLSIKSLKFITENYNNYITEKVLKII